MFELQVHSLPRNDQSENSVDSAVSEFSARTYQKVYMNNCVWNDLNISMIWIFQLTPTSRIFLYLGILARSMKIVYLDFVYVDFD